jgi:hypothetical protein
MSALSSHARLWTLLKHATPVERMVLITSPNNSLVLISIIAPAHGHAQLVDVSFFDDDTAAPEAER